MAAIEIKEFEGYKPKKVKEQTEKKITSTTKKAQSQAKPKSSKK